MAHHSGHPRFSKTVPSDHHHPFGSLSIAPALTKSEHLNRIVEWTRSIHPGPTVSVDDEQTVAHSLLIDEGVQRLRNWDNEMQRFGNDKNDQRGGRISEGTKLNLIADLNNIKRTVDPEDSITPRVIVQEFQKFMTSKNSVEPKRNKKTLKDSVLDKRVQFQSPKEREEVQERDYRQKALNVGFTVTYPDKPTTTKGIFKADAQSKQRKPSPKKGPDWWRRKIRQGFIETDELMSKLVTQRKQEEKIIHGIGTEGTNNGPSRAFQYRPKTYASIAERATRNERQRLDRSMERLRKRHEECFGTCTAPHEIDPEAADVQQNSASHINQQSPVSHAVTTRFDERPTTSIPVKPERNEHDEFTYKMNKLMTLGIPNSNKQAYSLRKNAIEKEAKNPNAIFKTPIVPKKSTILKTAEVQVIYERHSDGHPVTIHEAFSDHKMGSERWPQEYLKLQRTDSIRPAARSLSQNRKSGNSEWVKRFVEAHKKKIIKDEAEHKAILEKRKAETKAMYQELLFNQNRLEHEVGMERRRMQMSWKFSSPTWQKKANNKDKLPDRFRPYSEDVEERKTPKEPLKYTWKEQPKGLNMWLEGVMAKAKEDKEAKHKQKHKDAIVPLSSYQF